MKDINQLRYKIFALKLQNIVNRIPALLMTIDNLKSEPIGVGQLYETHILISQDTDVKFSLYLRTCLERLLSGT